MVDSKVVSIRLGETQLHELQKEAKEKGISFNTMISNVVERYLHFHKIYDLQRYHWVSHSVLKTILENIPKQKLELVTKIWIEEGREHTMMTEAQSSVDAMINANEKYLASMNLSFRSTTFNGCTKFIINHDLSKNWSQIQTNICHDLYGLVSAKLDDIQSDDKFLSYVIKNNKD